MAVDVSFGDFPKRRRSENAVLKLRVFKRFFAFFVVPSVYDRGKEFKKD